MRKDLSQTVICSYNMFHEEGLSLVSQCLYLDTCLCGFFCALLIHVLHFLLFIHVSCTTKQKRFPLFFPLYNGFSGVPYQTRKATPPEIYCCHPSAVYKIHTLCESTLVPEFLLYGSCDFSVCLLYFTTENFSCVSQLSSLRCFFRQ